VYSGKLGLGNKLGIGKKEQMLVNIPSYIGPLKPGTNYLYYY
jgi:hypothetical protein